MPKLTWLKELIGWSNELGQWVTMLWSHTPEATKKSLAKSWGGYGVQDNATWQFHILPKLSSDKERKAITDLLHVLDQHDRDHLIEMAEKAVLENKVEKDLNENKRDKKGNALPPKKVVEITPDFTNVVKGLEQMAAEVIAYQETGGTDLRGWVYAQHIGGGLFDQPTFKDHIAAVFGVVTSYGSGVTQVMGDAVETILSEGEYWGRRAQSAAEIRQSQYHRSWSPGRIIQRLFNL
jgi:hypothetical protein